MLLKWAGLVAGLAIALSAEWLDVSPREQLVAQPVAVLLAWLSADYCGRRELEVYLGRRRRGRRRA